MPVNPQRYQKTVKWNRSIVHRRFVLFCVGVSLCLVFLTGALPPPTGGSATILVPDPIAQGTNQLDPLFADTRTERQVFSQVLEPLFTFQNGTLTSGLVMEWFVDETHKNWTVRLNPAIRFHDGSPFTTDDMYASLVRVIRLAPVLTPNKGLLKIVGVKAVRENNTTTLSGFETVSPYECVIHLETADANFLTVLADLRIAMLPARQAKTVAPLQYPIGTGPFSLEQLSPTRAVLSAFLNHHEGRPFLDTLQFIQTATAKHIAKVWKSKEADAAFPFTKHNLKGNVAFGVNGQSVVLTSNRERHPNMRTMKSLLHNLIDCENVVRLFEHRARAPFRSELKNKSALTFLSVKATDPEHTKGLAKISEAIGISCSGFLPNRQKAVSAFTKLTNGSPLVLVVRDDLPHRRLLALRIALAAKDWGIHITVVQQHGPELAKTLQAGLWDLWLNERPSVNISKASSSLTLYRLIPKMVWNSEKLYSVKVNPFGLTKWEDCFLKVLP